uniref:Uncharacterized protein n=1 Tax=Strigamia maritima TaxID=126957 RepID=T1JJ83_STRMM
MVIPTPHKFESSSPGSRFTTLFTWITDYRFKLKQKNYFHLEIPVVLRSFSSIPKAESRFRSHVNESTCLTCPGLRYLDTVTGATMKMLFQS